MTTCHQGENAVEQPGAHQVLAGNTNPIEPARLPVVFVSSTGEKLKTDNPAS